MKQKVALTAAHLMAEGTVADMGMGSGSGSEALAALYPALSVVGVDVSPEMAVAASVEYHRANLAFVCADIAAPLFTPRSLDGIFDSSVLHHVTTFTGYRYNSAAKAIEVQVEQLREHGVLIIRDFVDPGYGEVVLELPDGDGDESEDPRSCSTARLFVRFAREFRALSPSPGFPFEELPSANGMRRFRVSRKIASEFVLRKDFRTDWATEVLEEYTYFTQEQFETLFARLGLRIITSSPIRNPWIVRNRFEGKFVIRGGDDAPQEFPPTNYIIVGEKVGAGEGVRFAEGAATREPQFLSLQHYRDMRSGRVMDLVRRPHPTLDIVPWFTADDEVFILARKSYPRPILSCDRDGAAALDGARAASYVTEPLSVLQQDAPLGRTVEEALERRAAISPDRIRAMQPGCAYYPSPGGIEEEVRSVLVEIEPLFVQERPLDTLSGFTTSGRIRAIEATQLLRAAQVGGLPEARLEINVYELLRRLDRSAGPWIGESIAIGEAGGVAATPFAQPVPRRRFVPTHESSDFLSLRRSRFDEVGADDRVLASLELEYVVPRALSRNTIATALLARSNGRILLGIDDDDLPAAQSFTGSSALLLAPAWRLPAKLATMTAAIAWIRERLRGEYGIETGRWWELGGKYHPTAGATPEVVHPIAFEIQSIEKGARPILWFDLAELIGRASELLDGHLRIVAFRAAHVLGLLDR
jgi:SAM-dependent methyltransferase